MGKRKIKSKRSVANLPKGLPLRGPRAGGGATTRGGGGGSGGGGGGTPSISSGRLKNYEVVNPFDVNHRLHQRSKFQIHNRTKTSSLLATATSGNGQLMLLQKKSFHNKSSSSSLGGGVVLSASSIAMERRRKAVKESMQQQKKANEFVDQRIGEYNPHMTIEEANLARLVRERARRSKRTTRFALEQPDDDNNNGDKDGGRHHHHANQHGNDTDALLTHKGLAVDKLSARDHMTLLNDDDDDDKETGQLDAADTALHFGGGNRSRNGSMVTPNPYGPSASTSSATLGRVANMYVSRKEELDDLIMRRKLIKAERLKLRDDQMDTFANMDEAFDQLASQLQFRDKRQEARDYAKAKRGENGIAISEDDQAMEDWDKEMKQYLYGERRVKAMDRTKTPEEMAKEEADRLHGLETRRLARMNGDFEADDLSDVSTPDEIDSKVDMFNKKRKRSTNVDDNNPEALDDPEQEKDDSDEMLHVRFSADGLVQVNKDGVVVGKVGEKNDNKPPVKLSVLTRVSACYHAKEQLDGKASWFPGTIAKINQIAKGSFTYDIDYDDGDFEEGVEAHHVKVIATTNEGPEQEQEEGALDASLKWKQRKAKENARAQIPFVFEVPTTLEALHSMISTYATTGEDASLIVKRIHAANSVRLDHRNTEKMQNFYDVVLRRFVAVGDALHSGGDGGTELGRYRQLDSLTQTLYGMAQDSPNVAGAVWSRRLGILQNAHSKRLRDAEFERNSDSDDVFTAWPSSGVILLLRVLGHVFPVTDLRHYVVTPAILFLGQVLGHTPVLSMYDTVVGLLCCGIMIDYTKESKRIVPEVNVFLAGIIRLFAVDKSGLYPLPSLQEASSSPNFAALREKVSQYKGDNLQLSLEKQMIQSEDMPAALLFSALRLVDVLAQVVDGAVLGAEKEIFAEILESILVLDPTSKASPLPPTIQKAVSSSVTLLLRICKFEESRTPILRRDTPSIKDRAINSLAPRLENPDKYSLSKDKGKNAMRAASDRMRREYKREHKAVSRELRLDAVVIEKERLDSKNTRDSTEKAKRHKAFAWMEAQQATLNQQVRQGGGLLKGGGVGAAKAKASTGKLGIKKGGKF